MLLKNPAIASVAALVMVLAACGSQLDPEEVAKASGGDGAVVAGVDPGTSTADPGTSTAGPGATAGADPGTAPGAGGGTPGAGTPGGGNAAERKRETWLRWCRRVNAGSEAGT